MIQKYLDLRGFQTPEELQKILAETLGFPEYYGENLDALYDMLTDICEDTCVEVCMPVTENPAGAEAAAEKNAEAAEAEAPDNGRETYAARVLEVLTDAAMENEHLIIVAPD